MAVNLTAVFRVRDQGTSRLRQITSMMDRMNRTSRATGESVSRSQTAVNRFGSAVSSTSNRMNGFSASISRLHVGSNGLSASFGGLQSTLIGLASAYLGAQGAAKAFNSTILAAANYEMSSVTIGALFDDTAKTKKYMQSVEKMALDSPILNSTEMYSSSKGLIAMTKDLDTLAKTWSIIERLQLLDPAQGTEGASFAMKEMFGGDAISLSSRFELPKGELNRIKKLDPAGQVVELDKMLVKMGYTQKAVNKMSETTLSQWSQITEKAQVFGRKVGEAGNTKLGDALRNINMYLEKLDVDVIAKRLGDKLGELTDKAITFGKLLWQWREPIVYVVGAIAAAVGALAGVGVIAALANPVSLIAAGIAAAVVGLKALYDNSETFRGAIEKVVTVVKDLWSVFQKGGVEGLISVLFPPDVADKINGIITGIKSKISELMTAFNEGGFGGVFDKIFGEGSFESLKTKFEEIKSYITEKITQFQPAFEQLVDAFSTAWDTVSDILTSAWDIIGPILSGLWDWIQILGDIIMIVYNNVIAPAISFLAQLFSTLWSIAKPILQLLGIAWEALSAIIKWAWDNVLAPLVEFILTGVKNALDGFSGALEIVQGWFETLSGWVSTAYGHVKDFIGFISNAKLPSWITNGISAGVNFVGDLIGAGDGKKGGKKSHYSGLDSVPYDGYSARLHKNEKVLTAQEAKAYDEGQGGSSGGVVITGNNFTVREEADIQRIAYELAKLIEKERVQVG